MTDRTDNARAERHATLVALGARAARAQHSDDPGLLSGVLRDIAHELRSLAERERAAGRAETTTEHEHIWQRQQNVTSRGYALPPIEVCQTEGCDAARSAETTTEPHPCLPSLGEPCGNCHRCTDPAETTTATTEDVVDAARRVLAEMPGGPLRPIEAAEALDAHGLLTTARTRPTRQQLIDALVMSPLSDTAGTDMRPFEQTADAVLALLADQPAPADVWDEAVEKIREQHPACENPCEMCAEMDDWLTALADNPYRGGAR